MRRVTERLGGGWVLALACVFAVAAAVASIIHHDHFGTGFDLAIFDQAVWHYSRFEAAFSSILGKNVLGDHFSPILVVLAPLYWIWSDPRMLLIAQSVLISASIVPVFLFARSRVGRTPGLLIAGAYAAFWGLQAGATYDFHELAFAPLLVALAILFADRALSEPRRGRWTRFWVVIVLLLLVKEDLSMFVVFFGIYLLTRRSWRHGLALVGVGVGWYVLTTRVLIPHYAGGAAYAHWTYTQLGKDLPSALWALVRAPWRLFTIGFSPSEKVQTLLALFAPFLFLSLGSPLAILAIPLLAERFLSNIPPFWGMHFQYSLSIAPVLAMAAADALRNGSVLLRRPRPAIMVSLAAAMVLASVAITRFDSGDSALTEVTTSSFYTSPPYAVTASQAIRRIPGSAGVLAPDVVLPHLSERDDIELISLSSLTHGEYLLTNVLTQLCCTTAAGNYAGEGLLTNYLLVKMTPVYYDAGWLIARRLPVGVTGRPTALPTLSGSSASEIGVGVRGVVARYVNVFACARLVLAHDPGAGACIRRNRARFAQDRRLLAAAITSAGPELRGGCAALADAARTALGRISLDVARFVAATRSGASDRVLLAQGTAGADQANLDLTGRLQRFGILCAPTAWG